MTIGIGGKVMKSKVLPFVMSWALLCSFVPSNHYYHSVLASKDLYVDDVIVPFDLDNQETVTTKSNVLQNEVGHVSMNYEVLKMYKYTELLLDYVPTYVMLYEANVYLNNKVHYKGGLFNWYDGYHAAFLKNISFSFKWNGVNNVQHSYCMPSVGEDGDSKGLRLLKDVYTNSPENGHNYYAEDTSSTYNKQTDRNCFLTDFFDPNLDECVNTASHIYSNSYYWSAANINNLIDGYDSRTAAYLTSSKTVTSNSVAFDQSFEYNHDISYKSNGQKYDIFYARDDQFLFSGPCTNGEDDFYPMYFTFYGMSAIQTSSVPTSINVSMFLDTMHGSHVFLDTFESTATNNFTINL